MRTAFPSFTRPLALAAGLALASLAAARAQAPSTTGPTPQNTTAVPIDGGASLLLAAGVGYGLRKLRQRRSPSPDA